MMNRHAMLELVLRAQMTFDYSEPGLAAMAQKLDVLHDAASAGRLHTLTDMNPNALRGWLHEIIYIARETLYELENIPADGRKKGLGS